MPKVTFIYDYKEGEEWSTPLSLLNEFNRRDWETDIVSINANDDSQLQLWIQQDIPTDMVIFMDWGRIQSKWLDKTLKPTTFWIQESGDDPQNWERNSPKSTNFHLTITPDYPSHLKYEKMGIKSKWLTHWADTQVQYPMYDVPIKYVAATTRGLGGSYFLDTLTSHGEGSIGNQNGMGGIEHSKFLQSGLMVIQNARWGEITRRIFEGMACGKLVIADRLDESRQLETLFTDGVDIVLYDDIVDCIEKINYYANNERERELIAQRGYENVLKNHTQKQRVDVLIKEYDRFRQHI
jgi:hypothetical protein